MNKTLFPVFLDISGRNSIIIGGGIVAERKASDLLTCGAQVVVISPQVTPIIADWATQGRIVWLHREFQDEDLQHAFLVFLATNDSSVNRHAVSVCHEWGILVNAVDDPVNCDFYVPSVLRRQSLAVAISTGGKSPLFARKLREELEGIVTEPYGEFVELLGEQRTIIQNSIGDIRERRLVFEALTDWGILELLKAGEKEKARERIEQCMSCLRD